MRRCLPVTAAIAALAAFSALATTPAMAQGRIGVIVGPTFSELRGVGDVENRTSVFGGLYLVSPLAGPVGIQSELLFVSKGADVAGPNDGVQLDYIEIPVLLRLNLGAGGGLTPHVYAGPYLGLQIDCKLDGLSGDCDDVDGVSTRTVDIGGALGGGLDFNAGPLVLTGGLRYTFGVSKVVDFDIGNVRESAKNGVFGLYAGVGFRFGR